MLCMTANSAVNLKLARIDSKFLAYCGKQHGKGRKEVLWTREAVGMIRLLCYQRLFNLCLVERCAGHAVTPCVSPSQVLFQFSLNRRKAHHVLHLVSQKFPQHCLHNISNVVTHCPILENWLKKERK